MGCAKKWSWCPEEGCLHPCKSIRRCAVGNNLQTMVPDVFDRLFPTEMDLSCDLQRPQLPQGEARLARMPRWSRIGDLPRSHRMGRTKSRAGIFHYRRTTQHIDGTMNPQLQRDDLIAPRNYSLTNASHRSWSSRTASEQRARHLPAPCRIHDFDYRQHHRPLDQYAHDGREGCSGIKPEQADGRGNCKFEEVAGSDQH